MTVQHAAALGETDSKNGSATGTEVSQLVEEGATIGETIGGLAGDGTIETIVTVATTAAIVIVTRGVLAAHEWTAIAVMTGTAATRTATVVTANVMREHGGAAQHVTIVTADTTRTAAMTATARTIKTAETSTVAMGIATAVMTAMRGLGGKPLPQVVATTVIVVVTVTVTAVTEIVIVMQTIVAGKSRLVAAIVVMMAMPGDQTRQFVAVTGTTTTAVGRRTVGLVTMDVAQLGAARGDAIANAKNNVTTADGRQPRGRNLHLHLRERKLLRPLPKKNPKELPRHPKKKKRRMWKSPSRRRRMTGQRLQQRRKRAKRRRMEAQLTMLPELSQLQLRKTDGRKHAVVASLLRSHEATTASAPPTHRGRKKLRIPQHPLIALQEAALRAQHRGGGLLVLVTKLVEAVVALGDEKSSARGCQRSGMPSLASKRRRGPALVARMTAHAGAFCNVVST